MYKRKSANSDPLTVFLPRFFGGNTSHTDNYTTRQIIIAPIRCKPSRMVVIKRIAVLHTPLGVMFQ